MKLIDGEHDLSLGEQIYIFRTRQGWSVEDLGRRLGLTGRSISAITNGHVKPSKRILKLLQVLKDNPTFFDDTLE